MEKEVMRIYDSIAKKYHKGIDYAFYNKFIEMPAVLSLLKNVKNKKILDIGCGSGRYTKILKKRGANVCGIDISPKMIEIARSEIKDVDFRVGSVYKMPYKPNSFDMVLAGYVVNHFKDLDKAFKEIYGVLKNGGFFIFSISNPVIQATKSIKGKPKNCRAFKKYFEEGKRYQYWPTFGLRMPYYHMTFQTLIKTIIKNKFVIEDYIDAKPVKNGKRVNPESYHSTLDMPTICVFKVRKTS